MPRFILIDNCSGFIFADTADLNGFDTSAGTPIDAARAIDESNLEFGREYTEINHNPRDTSTGYHVYRVDDAMPAVVDGQDRAAIETVERDGAYVTYVACHSPEWPA